MRAEPRHSAANSTAEDGLEQLYLLLTDAARARALESADGIPRSDAWSTRAASRAAAASPAPSAPRAARTAGPRSRVRSSSSSSVRGRSRSPLRRRDRSPGMLWRMFPRSDPRQESRAIWAAAEGPAHRAAGGARALVAAQKAQAALKKAAVQAGQMRQAAGLEGLGLNIGQPGGQQAAVHAGAFGGQAQNPLGGGGAVSALEAALRNSGGMQYLQGPARPGMGGPGGVLPGYGNQQFGGLLPPVGAGQQMGQPLQNVDPNAQAWIAAGYQPPLAGQQFERDQHPGAVQDRWSVCADAWRLCVGGCGQGGL